MKKQLQKALGLALAAVMCLGLLPASAFAHSPDIPITQDYFPDSNFRTFLKSMPEGQDGRFTETELRAITSMDCSQSFAATDDMKFTSLKGVENFYWLTELNCSGNRLLALDVSGLPYLKNLDCSSNRIDSLDLSRNPSLTELNCSENRLTGLDLSENTALTYLSCSDNKLTKLDLSKQQELSTLYCPSNQLTELVLTGNHKLEYLNCISNQVAKLDLTKCPLMETVYCDNNRLDELKVSGLQYMNLLQCSGNALTKLDLTGAVALATLDASHNYLTELNLSASPALDRLSVEVNNLTVLDLGPCSGLGFVSCYGNQLMALDVRGTTDLGAAWVHDQYRVIEDDTPLSQLSNFDPEYMDNMKGGRIENGKLHFVEDRITYDYNCGETEYNHEPVVLTCTLEKADPKMHRLPGYDLVWLESFETETTENWEFSVEDMFGWDVPVPNEVKPIGHHGGRVMLSACYDTSPFGSTGVFADNTLLSPVFTPGEDAKLAFQACKMGGSYSGEVLDVCVVENGRAPVKLGDSYSIMDGWHEIVVDLSEYAGSPIQIAFIHRGARRDAYLALDCVALYKPHSVTFTDVKESDYFYDYVQWAVKNGITAGISDTEFGPDLKCTRAQIVTFLWNAAGQPKMEGKNPFSDVKEGDWFYDAVLWAVEKDITSGIGEGKFGPNLTCSRSEAMTFLWKYLEKPTAEGKVTFTDVKETDWFYAPVQWAVEKGITAGVGGGKFGSADDCLRAQIVTFIYRAFNNK